MCEYHEHSFDKILLIDSSVAEQINFKIAFEIEKRLKDLETSINEENGLEISLKI